jgi:hypothetical protein
LQIYLEPELELQFGFAALHRAGAERIIFGSAALVHFLYFHGKLFCRIRNQRQILRFL